MGIAQGLLGNLTFAPKEATWGTAATVTKRVPYLRNTLTPTVTTEVDDAIDGFLGPSSRSKLVEGVSGSIEFYFSLDNLTTWFDLAFGTATYGSHGGVTTLSGPYLHTFNPKPILNSTTVEVYESHLASNVSRATGLTVNQMTISGASDTAGQRIKVAFDVVGKSMTTDVAASASPARVSPTLLYMSSIDSFSLGTGATPKVRDFEFVMKNNIAADRRNAGSYYIDQPLIAGRREVTLKVTYELDNKLNRLAYVSGALAAASIQFNPTSVINVLLTLPNCYVEDYQPASRDSFGLLTESLTLRAIEDWGSPSTCCTMAVNNPESTIGS